MDIVQCLNDDSVHAGKLSLVPIFNHLLPDKAVDELRLDRVVLLASVGGLELRGPGIEEFGQYGQIQAPDFDAQAGFRLDDRGAAGGRRLVFLVTGRSDQGLESAICLHELPR